MSHGNWKDLFKAVQDNDLELIKFHIANGVDINYQHPEYFTSPLIESIRLKHYIITISLLNYGASIELKEVFSGKNAIEIAKELRDEEALNILFNFINKC